MGKPGLAASGLRAGGATFLALVLFCGAGLIPTQAAEAAAPRPSDSPRPRAAQAPLPPLAAVSAPSGASRAAEPKSPAERPLRLFILSGAKEYEANASCAALAERLRRRYGTRVTQVRSTDKATRLPSLEGLDEADVLLVFLRRNTLPPDQLRTIQRWCEAGRPVVGVRTASHAFQNWLAFDREVLGGNYQGHYGSGPVARVRLVPEARGHPVLAGVEPFDSPYSLYKNTPIAKDATLLATATAGGRTEPVAWVRVHRGGRVFYTSLGGPKDFENPNFVRMLVNAVFWAAGQTPPSEGRSASGPHASTSTEPE